MVGKTDHITGVYGIQGTERSENTDQGFFENKRYPLPLGVCSSLKEA